MGVPKFYRWLSERYPLINQKCNAEEKPEFDNLYLDMNGIVHNCTHGDDDTLTKRMTEEQMFSAIFKYLDKLFNIARPKKLIYMAIDGVAPRAKMNQQRQRRFRSAQDAKALLEKARAAGEKVPDEPPFDSNCITPGTEFMQRLTSNLHFFIQKKMKEDSAWRNIKVVLSGAETPGEGEHKIMAYIRSAKMQPDYDPNLHHCLYGLDADLIMLALVTHEPHFVLLREEVVFGVPRGGGKLPRKALKKLGEFQFLHLAVLREYLDLEFSAQTYSPEMPYDFERIIDDWVFLGFCVGNDFIPHLPTLDIAEGGLDFLYGYYKSILPKMGYITENGDVHLDRLEQIFSKLGEEEEGVFTQRIVDEADFQRRLARRNRNNNRDGAASSQSGGSRGGGEVKVDDDGFQTVSTQRDKPKTELEKRMEMLKGVTVSGAQADSFKANYYKEKFPEFFGLDPMDTPDPYLEKERRAENQLTPEQRIRKLVHVYLEGMCWVLKYYYQGVADWKWFFSFRYAPLASDMKDLASLEINFTLGEPFRPCEQLLGVLPPASSALLPKPFQPLMLSPSSPLKYYYPDDFTVDMNGKRNPWEGIALIPFIEESQLKKCVQSIDQTSLTRQEILRNEGGSAFIFSADPKNDDHIPSPLSIFAPIEKAGSKKEAFEHDDIPGDGKFQPILCPGVSIPAPGFPSLVHENSGYTRLHPAGVNVFGRESKKESLLLQIDYPSWFVDLEAKVYADRDEEKTSEQLSFAKQQAQNQKTMTEAAVKRFLGRRCAADWPFLRECLVDAVIDGTNKYTIMPAKERGGRPSKRMQRLTEDESEEFTKDAAFLQRKELVSRGLEMSEVRVLLSVRLFEGMRRLPDGSLKKFFGKEQTLVPLQLAMQKLHVPDPRFVEKPPAQLEQEYPVGSNVVYIGPEFYGCIGSVVKHSAQGARRSTTIELESLPKTPDYSNKKMKTLRYFSSRDTAKKLGLHPQVLGRLTSSIEIKETSPDRTVFGSGTVNAGLNIKFGGRRMIVADYVRQVKAWDTKKTGKGNSKKDANGKTYNPGWEYSELTLKAILMYKERFPAFFEMLNRFPNGETDRGNYSERTLVSIQAELEGTEPERDKNKSANARGPKISAGPSGGKGFRSRTGGVSRDSGSSAAPAPAPAKRQLSLLKQIGHFLNSEELGIKKLILTPATAQVLPKKAVSSIHKAFSRFDAQLQKIQKTRVEVVGAPPFYLYRPDPEVHWSPTERDMPNLGARVLSLRSDLGVPFGLRGFIVAVHGKFVEVAFDRRFMTGTTLNGRCAERCGKVLPMAALLNLSQPRVLRPRSMSSASIGVTWTLKSAPYTKEVLESLKKKKEKLPKPISKQRAKMLALKPVIDGLIGDSSDESSSTDSEDDTLSAMLQSAGEKKVPQMKILTKNEAQAKKTQPRSNSQPHAKQPKCNAQAKPSKPQPKSKTQAKSASKKAPEKNSSKFDKPKQALKKELDHSQSEPALPPLPKVMSAQAMTIADDALQFWNHLTAKGKSAPASSVPTTTSPAATQQGPLPTRRSTSSAQSMHQQTRETSSINEGDGQAVAKTKEERRKRRQARNKRAKAAKAEANANAPPAGQSILDSVGQNQNPHGATRNIACREKQPQPKVQNERRNPRGHAAQNVPVQRSFNYYAMQYGGAGRGGMPNPGPQNFPQGGLMRPGAYGGGLMPPEAYQQLPAQQQLPFQQQQRVPAAHPQAMAVQARVNQQQQQQQQQQPAQAAEVNQQAPKKAPKARTRKPRKPRSASKHNTPSS